MKYLLSLLLVAFSAQAAPVVSKVEWRPACDGSTLEFVADGGQMVSVRANAIHSEVVVEWTIHYLDGRPVTAEFRESERLRVMEGENAGDYTGETPLKRLQTFKWQENGFAVTDKAISEDLKDILAKVEAWRDKATKSKASD
jgi:hypothetical protein